MNQQNVKLDPMLVQETAKMAAILTVATYINKVAELAGEKTLTDEQVVQVSVRAGEELPDSIATTLDNPAVTAGIIQKLTDASMELANAEPKTPSVTPENVELKNIGDGQILQQVAGNPHANTGGIEIKPDVHIIETELFTGKKAGQNPQQIEEIAMSVTEREFRDLQAKVAGIGEGMKEIVAAITKLASDEVTAVADPAKQGNNPTTGEAVKTVETPAAGVAALTADTTVISKDGLPPDLKDKGGVAANPNPDAGKIARATQIQGLIKKYVQK